MYKNASMGSQADEIEPAALTNWHRAVEAACGLGAGRWRTVWFVVRPIVGPSLIGSTLSNDEIVHTSQTLGAGSTPLFELESILTTVMTPAIPASGTDASDANKGML